MKTVSIHDDKSKRVLVYKEFDSGTLSPMEAFQALSAFTPQSAILEVGEPSSDEPYYSFIGIGECRHYETQAELDVDPFDQLRSHVDNRTSFTAPLVVPLAGTLLGYVAYDATRHSLRLAEAKEVDIPVIHLLEHSAALTFDHHKKKVYLSAVRTGYQEAVDDIEKFYQSIIEYVPSYREGDQCHSTTCPVDVNVPDRDFVKMVVQAKEYIRKGDAFQIVLSRKFYKKVSASPVAIYRSIREQCQSPYKFFIQTDTFSICGASPERLVKICDGTIENMPIAGTRPRTNTEEDSRIEKELVDDEKEHAEHMMLVDLARNDIGRVAEPGSVEVKELKKVYHYSHVMHLVSRVQGKLKKGISPIDALKASFPAGTLSGAPKIRAMEIIDQLESSPRGLYGGAICCIDHNNRVDSFIAIRMATIKDGVATVQAGAGVVIDSDPQKEADETRHKAKAILNAIELAQEVPA